MGGGGGGASSKLKKAARNFFLQTCGSLCERQQPPVLDNSAATIVPNDSANHSENQRRSNTSCKKISSGIAEQCNSTTSPSSNKSLCTICLDPLIYNSGQPVFTAQCSHSFHFACISSNVRHGSVTCPVCRAHWTQLPLNPKVRCSLHNKMDPALQILDDSIANFRVHRRSFLRSARYNDDDPIEPQNTTSNGLRLSLSLTYPNFNSCPHQASSSYSMMEDSPNNGACLRVRLSHGPAVDLVLVANTNGPHLRLMKQAMAMVVFSLRPVDRLAVVTYSSSAARVFPLRRMTSLGKRTALQVIDRVFYMGQADPIEGLKKGVKILEERAHRNQRSSILHLTDSPSRSHRWFDSEAPFSIQRFHLGLGFVVHEFEEFLTRTLGGGVEDIQLVIGEGTMIKGTMIVRIGELRGGEERNIPLYIGRRGCVYVKYSYRDSGDDECIITGEIVLRMEDEDDRSDDRIDSKEGVISTETRISSAENLEYYDPFMTRRWAKHLNGYRL